MTDGQYYGVGILILSYFLIMQLILSTIIVVVYIMLNSK